MRFQMIILVLAIAAVSPVRSVHAGNTPPPEAQDDQRVAIRIELAPLANLFMQVRALSERDDDPPAEFLHAVTLAQELQRDLGHPLSWAHLSAPIAACTTAAELRDAYQSLPESMALPGDVTVALRSRATAFARALEAVEPEFLQHQWPAQRRLLEASKRDLERLLTGPAEAWDALVAQHLHMHDPQRVIRVFLTQHAPRPGAVTFRSAGEGICFVALDGVEGLQLLETCIHEAIHAMDFTTMAEATFLQSLRRAMQEAGVPARHPLMRDLPHLIIFLQAGEVVRQLVDPEHVDYGVTHEVYRSMGEYVPAVRRVWSAYVAGELEMNEAIRRMIAVAYPAAADRP